nr:hypothetical protein [Polyangium fumosum]
MIRDEAGHPIRLCATVRDVTEQRRAERALQKSELLFRQVLETLLPPVVREGAVMDRKRERPAEGAPDGLVHLRVIVRVHEREKLLVGHLAGAGGQAKETVAFVRPGDLVRVDVPFPAPDAVDPLGAGEALLAPAKRLLGLLARRDVPEDPHVPARNEMGLRGSSSRRARKSSQARGFTSRRRPSSSATRIPSNACSKMLR